LRAVREQVAGALGHDTLEGIDPERNLLELGFDSLMAIELRVRLNRMTRLHMSTSVIFDHPTPAALATYIEPQMTSIAADLTDELNETDAPVSEPPSGQAARLGTLTTMLAAAHERGSTEQFMGLLATASMFRSTFDVSSAQEIDPQMVRLSEGDGRLQLICVPTLLAISGPHQYVRFARAFRGSRTVSALMVPGFIEGERVPLDVEAAVEALASAVERRASDAPFVLVGYSSGGWLAHAMASRLERSGEPVAAVTLIDTYLASEESSAGALGAIFDQSLGNMRSAAYDSISDDRLTAMGTYMRLLADWQPQELAARTLLIRASDPVRGGPPDGEWKARWSTSHEALDAPGDHFTLIEDHAESTARTVENWLVNATENQGVEEVC
jgi:thioesterase domain-containing protein/acyl carrier protein